MKKFALVLAVLLLVVSSAYALNDLKQDQDQSQAQGQAQGQIQGQAQGQGQNQKAESKSTATSLSGAAAIQGQLGIVGQSNSQTVAGDSIKTTVYANSWPSVAATEGVASSSASSIFGSVGFSNTELYKKLMPQIQLIVALEKEGVLTPAAGNAIIIKLVNRMLASNKTQRFLGIMFETDGRGLPGILSWGSFWKDGVAQGAEAAAPKALTVDKGVTGNGGNFK